MKIETQHNINDLITYEDGCRSENSRIVGIRTTTDAKKLTNVYYELMNGAIVDVDNAISPIVSEIVCNEEPTGDMEISKKYLSDQIYPYNGTK